MGKLSLNLIFFSFLTACSHETGFQTLSAISENRLASKKGLDSENRFDSQNRQSFSGSEEIEVFQLSRKQVSIDFLILPDSSKSMNHRLKNFGKSLSDLFYVISDYDWQMAFSSADHGDYNYEGPQDQWQDYAPQGKGRFGTLMSLENGARFLSTKILNPSVSNYENVFLHTLSHTPNINCSRPPFCSNPMEQPLRSLKSAIERAFLYNRPLFRSSSEYFVSLLASNEDERKEDPQRATSPEEVISAFNRQFKNKKFLHYSLVIKDENCLREEKKYNSSAGISRSSIKLSKQTAGPGAVMSLCSKNYGSDLRVISKHIKNQVENSFLLKKEPIPSSVELNFSKGPQVSWILRGREILFDNKNFENIEGTVSYQALK